MARLQDVSGETEDGSETDTGLGGGTCELRGRRRGSRVASASRGRAVGGAVGAGVDWVASSSRRSIGRGGVCWGSRSVGWGAVCRGSDLAGEGHGGGLSHGDSGGGWAI
jgi:hypothetical protein